ncbi:hypothetical protein WA026_001426 [Henosepilachna vigintioctopunctata]|uniref:Spermatogenesis-associated protein 20-like TRX domain-containing protein n=1 Tax=Henosepilachna vigintioctopunctata TaxID=420089 RepID=A0AAW1URX7_9CUCU
MSESTPAATSGNSAKCQKKNRLALEKSPYLLQHATNPVEWYPWGDEAFEKAKKENKLIFLSIGYSTCHWCHVMEKESFEDNVTAEIMNKHFVNIKVDREERPDLDRIYMSFIQATVCEGGWPMSIFLTPNLDPVGGGTYFPPEDGYGKRSFKSLLLGISMWWQERKDFVVDSKQSFNFLETILRSGVSSKSNDVISVPHDTSALKCMLLYAQYYDGEFGGFMFAPKFPQPSNFNFLFHFYSRKKTSPEGKKALEMCLHSLKKIAYGGIHDHVNGDSYPEQGAKEKREGAFCVWEYSELESLISFDKGDVSAFQLFCHHFGVKKNGNINLEDDPRGEFIQKNILCCFGSYEETAAEFDISVSEVKEILRECLQILHQERQKRPRPITDTKMVTSWQGLTISAYAKAGFALKEEKYIDRAILAANFVKKFLYDEESKTLWRCCYNGDNNEVVQINRPIIGFLDDYAFLIRGLLDLYEASLDTDWLQWAEALQETQDRLFWDVEEMGYFTSPSGDPSVKIRVKEAHDAAEPCGNSVSVHNLLKLAAYLDRKDLRSKAEETLATFSKTLKYNGIALPEMMSSLLLYHNPPTQVLISSCRC